MTHLTDAFWGGFGGVLGIFATSQDAEDYELAATPSPYWYAAGDYLATAMQNYASDRHSL